MLKSLERWIFFYVMKVQSHPEGAPQIPMIEALRAAEKLVHAREAFWVRDKGQSVFRIQQMQFDDENSLCTMLISFADRSASDPVFSDLEKGTIRIEPKLEGEGIAVSAHLVISWKEDVKYPGEYLVLLEDVPRIGKTSVQQFVNSIFSRSCLLDFHDENGETRKCRPLVAMQGQLSKSFGSELEEGSTVSGFELIQNKKQDGGLDEHEIVKEKRRQISYVIKSDSPIEIIFDAIKKVRIFGKKNGYENLRIIYRRPEGKQKSVLVGTFREDAHEALTVRSENVKSDIELPQCTDKINESFVKKMHEMLSAEND